MKYLLICTLFFLTACTSPREKALSMIRKIETDMQKDSTMVVNPVLGKKIIESYLSFAEQFPEDSLAPEYLFKAAEVESGIGSPLQAVDLYKKVHLSYPNYKRADYALFLQGFVYETQLKDTAKAKKIYRAFLKKYPNHHLSDDIEFSIQNMGKTEEELIREFEEKDI